MACLLDRLNPYGKTHNIISSPEEDKRCLSSEKSVVSYGDQLFGTTSPDILPTQSYSLQPQERFLFFPVFSKLLLELKTVGRTPVVNYMRAVLPQKTYTQT